MTLSSSAVARENPARPATFAGLRPTSKRDPPATREGSRRSRGNASLSADGGGPPPPPPRQCRWSKSAPLVGVVATDAPQHEPRAESEQSCQCDDPELQAREGQLRGGAEDAALPRRPGRAGFGALRRGRRDRLS